MRDSEIESIYYDSANNWAGFKFKDLARDIYRIDSPGDKDKLREVEMPYGKKHLNTRLIGFRTTKRCQTDKKIMSVQPIFYSIDEDLCKNQLIIPTDAQMSEIP